MGSCPSLSIRGGSWTMKIMSTVLSDRIQIHSGITYLSIDLAMFPQISGVFCKILPNFSKKKWFVWCKKSAWTNGQWWTVMGSCPSLPINGPSWTLNIMFGFLCDFKKIHSWVSYFSIDFATFPKISQVFSKILEYLSQYLWFLWC